MAVNKKPLTASNSEIKQIIKSILVEMNKAIEKHPVWPVDNVKRAAIVIEEAGEVIREANHLDEGHGDEMLLLKELYQTAGTCIRMIREVVYSDHKALIYYDPLTELIKKGLINNEDRKPHLSFYGVTDPIQKTGEPVNITISKESHNSAGKFKLVTFRADLKEVEGGRILTVPNVNGRWEINIIPEKDAK